MAKKEFMYRGKTLQELKELSINEFASLMPSRARRTLLRGLADGQETFMKKVEKNKGNIKTQCRDIIILPKMVGMTLRVHNGKEYNPIIVQEEMIGHRLGEFVGTRKRVGHNAPGIGATRSSAAASVR